MMVKTDWERPEKGKARSYAVFNEGRTSTKGGVKLFMPAGQQLDIRESIANGNCISDDFIMAIDSSPKVCVKINRYLKRNFKKSMVICSLVQDVDLVKIFKETPQLAGRKIDFSFLDLCGQLNAHNFYWLYANRECFSDDCRFGLTIFSFDRNSNFEPVIQRLLKNSPYIDDLECLLEDSKNNLTRRIFGGRIDVKNPRQRVKKNQAAMSVNVIKSIKANCYAFLIAMNDKDISINRLYRYKDIGHSEMVFIDFRFCGKKQGDTYARTIIDDYDLRACLNAQVIKRKVDNKKKRKTKKANKVAYIDMFNIKTLKDLNKPGIKAAITRLSGKEAKEMGITTELRRSKIVAGIKVGLIKRLKKVDIVKRLRKEAA